MRRELVDNYIRRQRERRELNEFMGFELATEGVWDKILEKVLFGPSVEDAKKLAEFLLEWGDKLGKGSEKMLEMGFGAR